MKFLVFEKRSKDKFTKKIYEKGSVHVFEDERAGEIAETGRAKEIGVEKLPKSELKKFANEFGINVYKMQKAEILEAIIEYLASLEQEVDETGEGQVDETGNGEGDE